MKETKDSKYWLKRFVISVIVVAVASYLLGQWNGDVFIFLRNVIGFVLFLEVWELISNKVSEKWGDKSILFRKIK